MIWEFAKNDNNMDKLELKELYKKKLKVGKLSFNLLKISLIHFQDADAIKKKLKTIIEETIKQTTQPISSNKTLTSHIIQGGMALYNYYSNCNTQGKLLFLSK